MRISDTTYVATRHFSPALQVLALVMMLFMAGCEEEKLWDDRACPEGYRATVTVPLTLGDVMQVTRGELAAGLDKAVTSLWVGVYNASTGERTGFREFSETELEAINSFHEQKPISLEAWSGRSYIVAVANYEFRPAADGTGKLGALADRLNEADTWEKFNAIGVAFDEIGGINIEAPLNALVMSGSYTGTTHTDGSRIEPVAVDINPGQNNLTGVIHLRRLYSQVKFNVAFNTANIKSAQVTSWQVRNLPTAAWLMERPADDPQPNSTDAYAVTAVNSDVSTRFADGARMTDMTHTTDKGTNKYSFDYWQLENRKTGISPAGRKYTVKETVNGVEQEIEKEYDATTAYKWRDREYKDASGQNTGRFMSLVENAESTSLNNMATYVEFEVSMEMNVDESGNKLPSTQRRLVNTMYIVHLGYCEGSDNMAKAVDFNCRRNTKYVYNVTVNNVNDLMVEAQDKGEISPGAEGLITDITDDYYELDAHYGAFNINLTKTNLANFQYYIVAYDENGAEVTIDSQSSAAIPADRRKYLTWVELRYVGNKNSDAEKLAEYKPDTGNSDDTYTLDELKSGGRSLSAGYYTVFINEYVYETATDGNESKSTAWWGYVNRPPRRAWINVSGDVSADGQTIHYKSKYALSQHSIQTYYNLGSTTSALGVEHTNETEGLNLRNNYNYEGASYGHNANSGRYNLAQYFYNTDNSSINLGSHSLKWSSYVENSAQKINAINNQNVTRAARTEPVPSLVLNSNGNDGKGSISNFTTYDPDRTTSPKYIEAIKACLNRNRDLNGNGYIDNNEIRWFVPTRAQLLRLVLGRRSMESPILNVDGITRLPNGVGDKNDVNTSMMFYTSDGRQMWLMEGTSDSWWRQWAGSCAAPWQVRCVRNLGSNMNTISTTNTTEPAFKAVTKTVNGKTAYYVDLSRYEARSIREEAYRSADNPMPIHHLYDQRYNRCYRSFEMFDSVIPLNDSRLGLVGKTIKLSDYLKNNNPCKALDYTGKAGWRVANQKELAIIASVGWYNLNSAGSTFQVSCTFGYFDYEGYVYGANPKSAANSIDSDYRFAMKVVSGNGQGTQAEKMNAVTVNGSYYGFRCVRDVDSY